MIIGKRPQCHNGYEGQTGNIEIFCKEVLEREGGHVCLELHLEADLAGETLRWGSGQIWWKDSEKRSGLFL